MHASLLDVLRCLGSQAADSLVSCMRDERALSAARLACHALRTFVDSSTTSLTITVRAADRQRWEAGQLPPPLAVRWPRCRRVTLKIMDGPGAAGDTDAALLALLPFVEPAAGRHVESLKLSPGNFHNYGTYAGTYGEALVCRLVPLLPNLRDLDFGLPGCMSFTPLHQQLMYSTLASLPRLERLTLPGCRSLDRVGALAASLRCLTIVDDGERDGENFPSAAAIAGLLQLQRLEELELPYCCHLGADGGGSEVAGSSGIQALLRASLPLSLQKLNVGYDSHSINLGLTLHAGNVTIMETSCHNLHGLATVAQLLLCSPAMGPTLELLSIQGFLALDGSHGDRQQADQVQLCKLLQRCVKVQTGDVWISSDTPAAAVVELLPLLGPEGVTLQFASCYSFDFSFPSASGKMPGISGPTAGLDRRAIVSISPDVAVPPATGGLGFQQQCSPPPGPADLLRAALQRMAAGGGPSISSSQQAASSNAEGGTLVPVTGSTDTPDGSLLLLQGPFVAMMANSGLAPTEWVRCLEVKADSAAPGNDWGGELVLSCQALPLVNGVLLSCSSATAAAGLMAASGAAAEAAAPMPLLEMVRLQSAHVSEAPKSTIFRALEPVMTAFWEGSAHGGEHCAQRERLQCLLALWEAFNALPEEVDF